MDKAIERAIRHVRRNNKAFHRINDSGHRMEVKYLPVTIINEDLYVMLTIGSKGTYTIMGGEVKQQQNFYDVVRQVAEDEVWSIESTMWIRADNVFVHFMPYEEIQAKIHYRPKLRLFSESQLSNNPKEFNKFVLERLPSVKRQFAMLRKSLML